MSDLRDTIRAFIEERDWEQFHSPKNLAMALSVEAAEIVEHFQWLTEEQSRNLPPEVETTVLMSVEETLEALAKGKDIGYRRPGESPAT